MKTPKLTLFLPALLVAGMLLACNASAAATANPGAANPAPAATSASSQASVAQAAVDGCSLLTKDQVAAVLGKPVDQAAGNGVGTLVGCEYKAGSLDFQVAVTQHVQSLDSMKSLLGTSAQAVPGLGDQALVNVNSNTLVVLKGGTEYDFMLTDSSASLSDAQMLADQKALAQQLLSNLH